MDLDRTPGRSERYKVAVALSERLLGRNGHAQHRAVSAEDVPGVVAMAATESGVAYEGVFGSRRIHDRPAMTRDTIFRAASMVKLITTVAALRLVEQGKLSPGASASFFATARLFLQRPLLHVNAALIRHR
jgi:hypothetical protein